MAQRSLLILLLLVYALSGRASAEGIGLRFERTGTDAASVTVSVVDGNGQPLSGASATLSASHSFKATGGSVTSQILCPDANANTSPSIELTFRITGAGVQEFNAIDLDIHALNGASNYQENDDGVTRQYHMTAAMGRNESELATFAEWADIDIAAGVGTTGAVHKVWTAQSAQSYYSEGDDIVLRIAVGKGTTNKGCFWGISAIDLRHDTDEPPVAPPADTDTYYIRWFGNEASLMTENADGSLSVASRDASQRQLWILEPSGEEQRYFIRNASTGNYIQSCNYANKTQVRTGTAPVEYYVGEASSASAVSGYARLTSTDCDNWADASKTPKGLNKDGASTNIIVWDAAETNTGSYWKLDLADPRPFEFSPGENEPLYEYTLCSESGKALEMDADGTLRWGTRQETSAQHWYFVGTNLRKSGTKIYHSASRRPLSAQGEEATQWAVLTASDALGTYYLRPFAQKDEDGTSLLVAGDSTLSFRLGRSHVANSLQVYDQPCGTLTDNYVVQATLQGPAALIPLSYPLPSVADDGTIRQPEAQKPSAGHTLFTLSQATLLAGRECELAVTFCEAPHDGTAAYAYFDWDRNGFFEAAHRLEVEGNRAVLSFTVPAGAAPGKTRLRLRLTQDGSTEADESVVGQAIDFVLHVTDDAPEAIAVTVSANDDMRGEASVLYDTDGTAAVRATAKGDASFLYWQEGRMIRSASADYTFAYDRPMHLTAFFTPNTQEISTGIAADQLAEQNALVEIEAGRKAIRVKSSHTVRRVQVFTPGGALAASSHSPVVECGSLNPGTYIVKVFTEGPDAALKVLMQ